MDHSIRSTDRTRSTATTGILAAHRFSTVRAPASGVGVLPRPGSTAAPTPTAVSSDSVAGLLLLVGAGTLLQAGWLIIWGLSARLTQGAAFTQEYLAKQPLIQHWLDGLTALVTSTIQGVAPAAHEPLLIATTALGFVIVAVGYLAGLVLLDRGVAMRRGAASIVVVFAVLFQLSVFLMPGVFTTDVFSYVMYGHIAGNYGLNPYVYPPSFFTADPILTWINPMWHDQPSVYGPLWTDLSWLMARAVQPLGLVDQVLAEKLLMNLLHLVNLVLVWWLVARVAPGGRSPRVRVTAFALFAWNPLLTFEVAGNAHNDGLMVTLLLLSAVPFAIRSARDRSGERDGRAVAPGKGRPSVAGARWAAAIGLAGLSALVKYTTAIVGLFYAVAWARQTASWRARIVRLGGTGLLLFGVTLALFWPWLDLPAALQPIVGAADRSRTLNSVPGLVAATVTSQILVPLGVDRTAVQDATQTWLTVLTRALFLVYLGWELRHVWRATTLDASVAVQAVLGASVRALLVLIVVALTWVLPWYFTWPAALAPLLGWQSTLARVAVAYTLTGLPFLYLNQFWWGGYPTGGLLLYAGLPLVIPLVRQARTYRQVLVLTAGVLIGTAIVLSHWLSTRPAPFCQPSEPPHFVFGFAALKAQLGDVMGDPLECEHGVGTRGDTRQETTTGFAYYRKQTNTPTFSRGSDHWTLTAAGLVHWTDARPGPPSSLHGSPDPPIGAAREP